MKILSGIQKIVFGTPEAEVPSRQSYVQPPKMQALEKLGEACNGPDSSEIRFSESSRGCRLMIPLSEEEDIYGLGLNLKSLVHTGKKRVLRVNSDPRTDTGDSHAPVPLYFSTAGYGVLVDTARYASFYCGSHEVLNDSDSETETGTQGIQLTEDQLYASRRQKAAMVIDIPVARGVEIYIFSGPTLLEAVRRYVLFCGGGALPPEWGLGCWYRSCGTAGAEEVEELADELRQQHIPCDVLGLEPGWQSRAYSCSFVWSDQRFPEPQVFITRQKDKGFHLNLWEHAFTHPASPLYQKLKPFAGDFKVWKGLVPDLSCEEAIEVFAGYHEDYLTSCGISSFKLDECDNSDFILSPWSFPECSQFPSGLDGETMHSMFGMLYMNAILKACERDGKRSLGNVRNAHAFAPPMPFVLYSDLYDHQDFIRGVASCGFSGLLWTPELRHAVSELDYLRRLETMVLAPQMLLNIWSMPNPPWMQLDREKNCRGEFYDTETQKRLLKQTRDILRLRMQFLPYLYEAFAEYHDFGTPPFRALVMDYPDDLNMRKIDWAWMVGQRLMVIPFRADMTELTMPLPEGTWYDFYTGECFQGEVKLQPAPEKLPILVRGSAVIPTAVPIEFTQEDSVYSLELRIYGPEPVPARLYADDGISWKMQKSEQNLYGQVTADGKLDEVLTHRYCVVRERRYFSGKSDLWEEHQ